MSLISIQVPVQADTVSRNLNIYDNQQLIDSFNNRSRILHGVPGETVTKGYGSMTLSRFASVDVVEATHTIDNIWVEKGNETRLCAKVNIFDSGIINKIKEHRMPIFGVRAVGSTNKDNSIGRIITIDIIGFKEDKNDDKE